VEQDPGAVVTLRPKRPDHLPYVAIDHITPPWPP
jgi:hypothetical protein